MGKFKSILEKSVSSRFAAKKLTESASPAEEDTFAEIETDDGNMSIEDIFDIESEGDNEVSGVDAEPEEELSLDLDVEYPDFDKESAKEEKGDAWFTDLAEPVEKFLKISPIVAFKKGEAEIDWTQFGAALSNLFSHYELDPFEGNIIEDKVISISPRDEVEMPTEDSFEKVEIEDVEDVNGDEDDEESIKEALDDEDDSELDGLKPINEKPEGKNCAEILSLVITWDGTVASVEDYDVDYDSCEDKDDGGEDKEDSDVDKEDSKKEDEGEDEDEAEPTLEGSSDYSSSVSVRDLDQLQNQIDYLAKVNEEINIHGGAKDDKLNGAEKSIAASKYHFDNGVADGRFVDGVENMSAVDAKVGASDPKSGKYFAGTGELGKYDVEDDILSNGPTNTLLKADLKQPKLSWLPDSGEENSAVEKEGIRENSLQDLHTTSVNPSEYEFNNGGKVSTFAQDIGSMSGIRDDSTDAKSDPRDSFEFTMGSHVDKSKEDLGEFSDESPEVSKAKPHIYDTDEEIFDDLDIDPEDQQGLRKDVGNK